MSFEPAVRRKRIAAVAGVVAALLVGLLAPFPPRAAAMAAVAVWMAVWWVTEAIPLYATALLTEEINALRPTDLQVIIPQVDARLWSSYHTTHWPHHLTRTITGEARVRKRDAARALGVHLVSEKPTIGCSDLSGKRRPRARRGRTFVDAPVETSDEDLRAGGAESWVGDARLFDHGDYCCTRARALNLCRPSSKRHEHIVVEKVIAISLEKSEKKTIPTKCSYEEILFPVRRCARKKRKEPKKCSLLVVNLRRRATGYSRSEKRP